MAIAEVLFVDRLIFELKNQGVEKFPYDTDEFYEGIRMAHDYFLKNYDNMGPYNDDIAQLFERHTFLNYYPRFKEAIHNLEGTIVHLDEDCAEITINIRKANGSFVLPDIGISKDDIKNIANCFLEGSNIHQNSYCLQAS